MPQMFPMNWFLFSFISMLIFSTTPSCFQCNTHNIPTQIKLPTAGWKW